MNADKKQVPMGEPLFIIDVSLSAHDFFHGHENNFMAIKCDSIQPIKTILSAGQSKLTLHHSK